MFESPCQKAINWVKKYRINNEGIVTHHKSQTLTPEVTGYLITSLFNAGEKQFAYELGKWELSIQKSHGGFSAPGDTISYTFDTAQVIRGFLTLVDEYPEFKEPLLRACDYVEKNIADDGKVLSESYEQWRLQDGTSLSEYGNLYVLPPLLWAGEKFGIPRYVQAARRSMEYFRRKDDLVEFKSELGTLSHYFGYMMEALADLGEIELAKKGLGQARAIQSFTGRIPAYPGATWTCPTGTAQLAIAWIKVGDKEQAKKTFSCLKGQQNASGGFYGGMGKNVPYFPKQEISWAAKFFIDLCLLMDRR